MHVSSNQLLILHPVPVLLVDSRNTVTYICCHGTLIYTFLNEKPICSGGDCWRTKRKSVAASGVRLIIRCPRNLHRSFSRAKKISSSHTLYIIPRIVSSSEKPVVFMNYERESSWYDVTTTVLVTNNALLNLSSLLSCTIILRMISSSKKSVVFKFANYERGHLWRWNG